jgi:hypothetical protein
MKRRDFADQGDLEALKWFGTIVSIVIAIGAIYTVLRMWSGWS